MQISSINQLTPAMVSNLKAQGIDVTNLQPSEQSALLEELNSSLAAEQVSSDSSLADGADLDYSKLSISYKNDLKTGTTGTEAPDVQTGSAPSTAATTESTPTTITKSHSGLSGLIKEAKNFFSGIFDKVGDVVDDVMGSIKYGLGFQDDSARNVTTADVSPTEAVKESISDVTEAISGATLGTNETTTVTNNLEATLDKANTSTSVPGGTTVPTKATNGTSNNSSALDKLKNDKMEELNELLKGKTLTTEENTTYQTLSAEISSATSSETLNALDITLDPTKSST